MAAGVVSVAPAMSPVRRRRILIEHLQAYLFLLPALGLIGLFKIFPTFFALYISLFRWDVVQGAFRGLDNYADILFANPTRAEQFWRSLSTTFTFALLTVPLTMAAALTVAVLLFKPIRGRSFYRTLFYLPYVTSLVAAATIFSYIFHPNFGIVNEVLGLVGIGPQHWFNEPHGLFELIFSAAGVTLPDWAWGPSLALIGVAIFNIWHFFGFQVVIFMAGLGNISPEYYEAARLDGASERQIFTKITLPLLSPTTFFVFTIAMIGTLRAFESIYVMTNGGPLDTTRTTTMLIFRTFFQQTQLGLGSAMAFLLTLIILLFTLIQFRVLGRRVHYS
ncbi:MAG: sugar ABC transporter permease [Chloroflexi bacterium]|nr:sugar ABC transporter permease [Chloroflexota bacterium]